MATSRHKPTPIPRSRRPHRQTKNEAANRERQRHTFVIHAETKPPPRAVDDPSFRNRHRVDEIINRRNEADALKEVWE